MYAIVQYEDRPLGDFEPLVKQNKLYAEKYGIRHILLTKGFENLPPWWRKVFVIRELLSKFDAILWVDSDAAIVGNYHFKDLFAGMDFVLSPNPPMLGSESLSMFSAPFCAGVWAVKNSSRGVTIMNRWCEIFNRNLWVHENSTWKHTKGLYAGIAYEQGAFEVNIWRCADFYPWILNKCSRILNYLPLENSKVVGKSCPSDVFAVHYWKGNRSHIRQHWN